MAFFNFPGETVEWLKARLKEVNEELVSDKALVGWGNAGSSASKIKGNVSASERQQRIIDDLKLADPNGGWDQYDRRSRCSKAKFSDV
jgi:hypothetical protein